MNLRTLRALSFLNLIPNLRALRILRISWKENLIDNEKP